MIHVMSSSRWTIRMKFESMSAEWRRLILLIQILRTESVQSSGLLPFYTTLAQTGSVKSKTRPFYAKNTAAGLPGQYGLPFGLDQKWTVRVDRSVLSSSERTSSLITRIQILDTFRWIDELFRSCTTALFCSYFLFICCYISNSDQTTLVWQVKWIPTKLRTKDSSR